MISKVPTDHLQPCSGQHTSYLAVQSHQADLRLQVGCAEGQLEAGALSQLVDSNKVFVCHCQDIVVSCDQGHSQRVDPGLSSPGSKQHPNLIAETFVEVS